MVLRIFLTVCLWSFYLAPAYAQGAWLENIFSPQVADQRMQRREPRRIQPRPPTSSGDGTLKRSKKWQTSEPLPGPLPEVPVVIASEPELVIHVWLKERMAGVYRSGELIQAMPIVPGSKSDPSTHLIGKTISIGDKTKDYWSRKRYPDRYGRMTRAWMAYASRLWIKQGDGTWLQSGFFFHRGDMSVWQSATKGSHGCFRLTWQHAIWVFENVPKGTPVIVKASMADEMSS